MPEEKKKTPKHSTTASISRELREDVKKVIDNNSRDLISDLRDIVRSFIEEDCDFLLNEENAYKKIMEILAKENLPIPSTVTPKAKVSNKKFLSQLREMFNSN